MNKNNINLSLLLILFVSILELNAESWHEADSPSNFGIHRLTSIYELPNAAQISSDKIWKTNHNWPLYQGGIARRWQQPNNSLDLRDYWYKTLQPEDVFRTSSERLSKLSPAEKYDILSGRFDFPLTNYELEHSRQFVNLTNYSWEIPTWLDNSIGWAIASINWQEPLAHRDIQLRSGQILRFYPEDIKALLTSFYSNFKEANLNALGDRCFIQVNNSDPFVYALKHRKSKPCNQINAGSFHTIVTSLIAQNQSVILDIGPTSIIQHHPIVAYNYNILSQRKFLIPRLRGGGFYLNYAHGTKKVLDIEMQLKLLSPFKMRTNQNDTSQNNSIIQTFYYQLELNSNDQIIGGSWNTQLNQTIPELLWKSSQHGNDHRSLIDLEILRLLTQSQD